MDFGYARVSSKDQNPERQVRALGSAGIDGDRIFVDKASGKDFDRPEYRRMLTYLRPGDAVFVQSIDRLGRSYGDIRDQWGRLTGEVGVDIVVLDMPLLDTRQRRDLLGSFISDLVLQVLSYVAEDERLRIRERQREGIEAAKALRGSCGGRRPTDPSRVDAAVTLYMAGKTAAEAGEATGVSRSVLYRALEARGLRRAPRR